MYPTRLAFLVLVSILSSGRFGFSQDDPCRIALERAAYDEMRVQTDRQFEASAITSIKQHDFQQFREALSGGADIEVGPFSLGGEAERQRFEEMKRYYERTGDTRLRSSDRSFVMVRVASKTAYDAWVRCVETQSTVAEGTGQPV